MEDAEVWVLARVVEGDVTRVALAQVVCVKRPVVCGRGMRCVVLVRKGDGGAGFDRERLRVVEEVSDLDRVAAAGRPTLRATVRGRTLGGRRLGVGLRRRRGGDGLVARSVLAAAAGDPRRSEDRRRSDYGCDYLTNGSTALRTSSTVRVGSNASGAGISPARKRTAAAWRPSTWTMVPAVARSSLSLMSGAAPL